MDEVADISNNAPIVICQLLITFQPILFTSIAMAICAHVQLNPCVWRAAENHVNKEAVYPYSDMLYKLLVYLAVVVVC